jgi:YHS domain-containing protein
VVQLIDRRSLAGFGLAALALFATGRSADAQSAASSINISRQGLALRGYDPVAYFTAGKAAGGRAEFTSIIDGVSYRFASGANKSAFDAEPAKYLPQYGGFCAWAAAEGYKADADPNVWDIVDGKLYLNYNASVGRTWRAGKASFITKADANWPKVKTLPLR